MKERKLVQWALAYMAGAFLVFRAVEVIAGPWELSPAFQKAVHVVLVMGPDLEGEGLVVLEEGN